MDAPIAPQADPADVEANKAMAILAYIIFFIPLLAARESKFAMYHANQGLTLFLTWVAVWVVGAILQAILFAISVVLGLGFSGIWWIVYAAVLVLVILGILNAAKGEMKPLPIIGKITFIK